MNRIIGVTELQKKFRTAFDEVAHKHAAHILTRGSRPEAAFIPYDQNLKFAQADEAGVPKRFDDLLAHMAVANAKYTDEEVQSDLNEATRMVRARKHKQCAPSSTQTF